MNNGTPLYCHKVHTKHHVVFVVKSWVYSVHCVKNKNPTLQQTSRET